MNIRAIADAIATHFVGVTANGESPNYGPTASLPNALPPGAVALIVFPPTGTLDVGVSAINGDEYDFPVRLLRDPIDVAARTDAIYAWADALRLSAGKEMALGLSYVGHAEASALTFGINDFDYNGAKVDAVELVIHVQMFEPGYPP